MPNSSPALKSPLRLFWLLPVTLIGAGGIGIAAMLQPPPADLDLSLTQATERGLYIGTLEPGAFPIPVGPIQTWTIAVILPDGRPLEHADLSIDGGMPQHGHGLPTAPQITEDLGGGRYRVEGLKFNLHGWWTIKLSVSGASGTDSATFNLSL
jgi:hypothetical protein